jgi:hypothetical protein
LIGQSRLLAPSRPRQTPGWKVRLLPMIWRLPSVKILRLTLSLSLMLWVSGAGCVLGCESHLTASDERAAAVVQSQPANGMQVVSGEACASAGDHNFCKHHASSARTSSTRHASPPVIRSAARADTSGRASLVLVATPEGTMGGCPLALNATALATKARTDESANSVALAPNALPVIDLDERNASSSPRTFLNNRVHTYLRCCVFLI